MARTVPSIVQLTVTGLGGTAWEPGVPPFEALLPAIRELAARLPHGAIRWRFDPIIPLPDLFDRFRLVKTRLAEALGGVEEVIVSFPDPYKKAVERVCASGLAWPRASLAEQGPHR